MKQSIIRHLITSLLFVVGIVPGTKVLVPVIEYINQNLDNFYTTAGALAASIAGIIQAWKYGRGEGPPPVK